MPTPIMVAGKKFNEEEYNYDDTIPAGTYTAVLTKAEGKFNQKGAPYTSLWIKVLYPEQYAGFMIFHTITNDEKANERAKSMAARFCKEMKEATGMNEYWEEAYNKPICIHTKIQVGDDDVSRTKITRVERVE